ncbi:replication initiation protein [Streptococcus phage Javan263]|uniref:DnaD and phage-associated domain-containing protein n=2 Tax=Streptococcus infantarius TaxID=102684 RepID=A0A380KNZ7_9STRE|nr:phage replisome organizer N-terminal domain-containing protein [Streptococcus infantarius]EDT47227.1 phage replisome organizer N-terminal domain protein [Streptococcus infantarius subsp. infantarius ATCC BAA-102]QBX16609.1 replication initiation protein [Streptococcus phage Javan263]QQB29675.1 phage replisome organizer N-terminal domain-containing protein [Streptococcus infantarius]SUN68069.1 dnaD and phage-associated domain-containing protein [Streptococcus infantarius]
MADNKKYYYLKLKENFFESDEAIILESMPDGYIYSNILLKLYLRSLKNDGLLMFNNLIPYNAQMLATITRHQVGTVEKAIQIFQQLKLIEILDNGAIYMSNIQNFVGKSSSEGDRKRAKRAQNRAIRQTSGQMSDKRPPEIEIDTETEIKKDIELKKELELEPEKEERFVDIVEANLGRGLVKFEYDTMNDYLINKHVSKELFLEAVKVAVANNVRKFNYISRVLDNWIENGIQTVEQAYQAQRDFKAKKANRYQANQPAKSNVPDWVDEDYKHEATVDEQAQLEALKKSMLED